MFRTRLNTGFTKTFQIGRFYNGVGLKPIRPMQSFRWRHGFRQKPTYVYFDGSQHKGHNYGGYGNYYNRFKNMSIQEKRVFYSFGAVVVLFIASHIEQAPVTHRYRLMITADWIERMFTNSSFQQVMDQYGRYVLPKNHPITKEVSSIMVRLISAAHNYVDPENGNYVNLFTALGKEDIPLEKWEFYVIDDEAMGQPSPNAFVIGGGKVFIFRSILSICEDKDGLATVLSHELGHLLADHLGEKLTLSPFFISLNIFLYSIFGSSSPGDILINAILNTRFSREMETEADYIGLMVMARACFNPTKAPKLWQNMMKFEQRVGQKMPELISTHPSSERRFKSISEWMPKALGVYERSNCQQMHGFQSFRSFF
jgi:Zn-dependent protease with chaperone function